MDMLVAVEVPVDGACNWTIAPEHLEGIATDPNGHATGYTYDLLGRLLTVTDALPTPGVTRFTYDAAGRLTNVVDARGGEETLMYDARGRIDQSRHADRRRRHPHGRTTERNHVSHSK